MRRLEAGELLIKQGAPNTRMYLLLEGTLAIHLDDSLTNSVAKIRRGETVGEISILDGELASAHVIAETNGWALEVDDSAFWKLISDSHAFAILLLGLLGDRLRANNQAVRHSAQERARFERETLFDSLTGVHNRKWLDQNLARITERYLGDRITMSVALVSVDQFRRFNDALGHDVGDFVLASVATSLARSVRPTDLVARFDGVEFMIIFPGAPLHLAMVAAERIRDTIAKEVFTLPGGIQLPTIRVSIGVAQLQPGQSDTDLLKQVRLATKQAKADGRNRVRGSEFIEEAAS